MSFFEKLYEGKYAPIEEETPNTDEFKKQWDIMSNAEVELRKTFTQEQTELFEVHRQAQLEIENMLHVQAFAQGFRIGAEFKQDLKDIDHLPEEK